ncbi:MAG: helix-turn-helix domain-containing protein [Parascardovia denticolens]|uniref:helix-turn-helix domain-containing protein n=1 Tax=Parascardovia denticolens TaxID=78258 RepID=UPI00055BC904|nr:helix-turn-helix transcriptional regulator [Parascardovia denticolens]
MIVCTLDLMLAKRKMSLTELSRKVGITLPNLSILKTGKAKAIRFETLAKLCQALECQPGDLFGFQVEGPDGTGPVQA